MSESFEVRDELISNFRRMKLLEIPMEVGDTVSMTSVMYNAGIHAAMNIIALRLWDDEQHHPPLPAPPSETTTT